MQKFVNLLNEKFLNLLNEKFLNILNEPLHGFLGFCIHHNCNSFHLQSKHTMTVKWITPQNYATFHYRMKIGKISCLESMSTDDVKYRCNDSTHCTHFWILASTWFFQISGYQFVNQGNLCLQILLYIFHYRLLYVMGIAVNFHYDLLHSFYLDLDPTYYMRQYYICQWREITNYNYETN